MSTFYSPVHILADFDVQVDIDGKMCVADVRYYFVVAFNNGDAHTERAVAMVSLFDGPDEDMRQIDLVSVSTSVVRVVVTLK